MNENAGLDDPDGGDFYPVVEKKNILMKHEEFDKIQTELPWPKMVRKNKSRWARVWERNQNRNRARSRSRSRDASTGSSTRGSDLSKVNQSLTDTPL